MKRFEDISFGTLSLDGNRPYLIAEAGVNHENSLEEALLMVEEAAKAGADAIKFQSYKAGKIASVFSPAYWDLKKESTTSQHTLFKKYDSFNTREYKIIAEKALSENIAFMSTPFDHDFADDLIPLMPVVKIASADITNYPLIRYCAKKGKPVILSVGASTREEIRKAISIIEESNNNQIALLHCVLSYPTSVENANLQMISGLKESFPGCIIGYSDHVPPYNDCLPLTIAWLLGARILEKHFTLDKTRPGNDHYHAMDPSDIRNFRQQCEIATALLGQKDKKVLDCELEARKQARRSIVAARNLQSGEIISEKDLLIKRPGTGISPEDMELVIGKQLLKDVREDELLKWEMFPR